ncbi:MAG: 50S ribosomal protein L4 [Planctomycetes bacterium]|nr:50S ribosomal protein L4 [Planctomycetota bacterium]MBL7007720.1 50S ribosomal protein L4 [Planctomycetota bacterium]
MSTITTYDVASGAAGEKECSLDLGDKVLYRTMKDAIVQYQANRRQGDAHTKTRAEVAGNTKKPWKQKKTGRARAGDRKSPLWRGGGNIFGPRNTRNWGYHLPRKQRQVALRSALLGKLLDAEVKEMTGLSFDAPSAKTARRILADLAPKGSALVLTKALDPDAWKSFRNFPRVRIMPASEATAYDLLAHKWLLLQEGALEALASRFPGRKEA